MPNLLLQPRVSFADNLASRLPRMTGEVQLQRIVHESKPQHRRSTMALADKMKRLAERSTSVPKSLEMLADKHLAKLDALEVRGNDAFGKLDEVMQGVETGVSAAEDALNQLTNGGPSGPLPD